MNYEEWEPLYLQIVRDFGYSVEEDLKSAEILADLIAKQRRPVNVDLIMNSLIRGFRFIILGPCLLDGMELGEIRKRVKTGSHALATVGEGTGNALRAGLAPRLTFTDLDGSPQDDIDANSRGAVVVIHAHGDNVAALKEWLPKFPGPIIPTCQCKPFPGINNWGGFTDGDRAFCALRHFGAKNVEIVGFDFDKPCGSKRADFETKKHKLEWAERIIESQDR
jgi:hypothetical protein